MGLVRAGSAPHAPGPHPLASDAGDGGTDAAAQRRREAHALGQTPGSETELAARLRTETEASVREALSRALVARASRAAAEALAELLHSEDAGLRNTALEALIALPDQATALLDHLLTDPDPGLRIFGVLLAGDLPLAGIDLTLFALLRDETDPNVCATLLEVLLCMGHALPATLHAATARRFRAEPFVQFLLAEARGADGLRPMARP